MANSPVGLATRSRTLLWSARATSILLQKKSRNPKLLPLNQPPLMMNLVLPIWTGIVMHVLMITSRGIPVCFPSFNAFYKTNPFVNLFVVSENMLLLLLVVCFGFLVLVALFVIIALLIIKMVKSRTSESDTEAFCAALCWSIISS